MRQLFLLLALVLAGCSSEPGDSRTKHALVIGIDGVRPDALREASTPRLDALIAEGTVSYDAFAGGVLGTETEQLTFSGPGWSSILTGVWVDKHGVTLNDFDDARFDAYPHFYAHIRELKPDAYLSSFVSWGPINWSILPYGVADAEVAPLAPSSAEADRAVTEAVVANIAEASPAVLFVHLDEVDHQGHAAGYSPSVPEYVQAIETVDAQIGEMLDAVRARPELETEDWLLVVTTDHGGTGNLHGGQSEEEREIFFLVSGGSARPGEVVSPGPGHAAVPPTVMKHLGIPVDPAWGWESPPFGL